MELSCCLWALGGDGEEQLSAVAEAGFDRIDIRPDALQGTAARNRARALGLEVNCIAAAHGLPEGVSLDNAATTARAQEHIGEALEHGADLGADTAYLVSEWDISPGGLACYGRAVTALAEEAAALDLKLCIEPFPDRALTTVASTLDFLQGIGHPNLYVLFDLGHVQIAGEDPEDSIEMAGAQLGYVHLDDNDGQGDLHLPLLEGILTQEVLERTFAALHRISYPGAVSLELSDKLPDPLGGLVGGRKLTEPLLGSD